MRSVLFVLFLVTISLSSCGPQDPSLFGDESLIVTTPQYRANRIFYVDTPFSMDQNQRARWSNLVDPLLPNSGVDIRSNAVQNGDPVSIVINRVSLPKSLTDDEGAQTRDIAVLLDFAGQAGTNESSIVVWYQRDVPADEPLSFQDLIVYSQDSWDNRLPPYFRMRIVDVTAERNVRTKELLNQVSNFSGTLSQVISTPISGAVVGLAERAAQLVLANRANTLLIDFTFNLFSSAQIDEAGGMPLGLFKRGGLILFGLPNGESRDYWENDFIFDHQTSQVWLKPAKSQNISPSEQALEDQELDAPVQLVRQGQTREQIPTTTPHELADSPYLLATIITSESIIPTVVARRSRIITDTLSNPELIRQNIGEVIDDVVALTASLKIMQARETFARFPTSDRFRDFVDVVEASTSGLDEPEKLWTLSAIRNVVGIRFSDAGQYIDWLDRCATKVPFDAERRRYDLQHQSVSAECKS